MEKPLEVVPCTYNALPIPYLPFHHHQCHPSNQLALHSTEFQPPLAYTAASFPCDKLHPLPSLVSNIPSQHAQIPCNYNIESQISASSLNLQNIFLLYVSKEKAKEHLIHPKPVPNSKQRLHLLHTDLCGPMRIASINGKRVGISHQVSSVRTPRQNGVVEHRNQTLVEAARTMLIFSRAPLFLWAEAIATACFTQNRSIIHRRFNKTPHELINGRKPDISFLHVFRALCYPKNDREDIGKLGAKGDIGFFIGYSADSCAYRVYNQRTKKIMETINVSFDELSAMAFEQRSSKPRLQSMTSGQINSGLDLTYASSTITTQQPTEGELDLLFEAMYDDYIGGQPSAALRNVSATQAP
nr:retrovirus-related Pol polyprotein from transposon TNT 1-94 [Tanacetum cinerariifolium]